MKKGRVVLFNRFTVLWIDREAPTAPFLLKMGKADSLFRHQPKQTVRLLDQQLYPICIVHRSAVSVSLADRDIFQMDQTAPSDQSVLWNYRECRQNPDLDRHYCLRVGGYHQKSIEDRLEPLHNSTDF
jgi:hypothetical protein